jgi:hypothetical protein
MITLVLKQRAFQACGKFPNPGMQSSGAYTEPLRSRRKIQFFSQDNRRKQ